MVVSVAAQAFAGPETLIENSDDVLATLGTDVLGSPLDKLLVIAVLTSAAASTQTTILPTARTSLSMAFAGAAPKRLGNIHPRYLTPSTSTIWMGVLLGGLILAWVFIKSCIDLANPENSESGDSWLGLGPPLVIGVGFLLFGVVLMFLQQRASPEFFRRRPEVVGPDGTAISAPTVAPDEQGGISDGR